MGRDANKARPAACVSRTSNRGVWGTPAGVGLLDPSDGAEEAEDGREMLHAEDAVVEVESSEGHIVMFENDRDR